MFTNRAFTLLEMIVVIAIMAVLVLFAFPSYRHHVLIARRQHAELTLALLSNQLEQYHMQHNSYLGFQIKEKTPFYRLEAPVLSDVTYRLSALPIERQGDDNCGTLSIDEKNNRSASRKDCWR